MNQSGVAQWLNSAFGAFDHNVLNLLHNFAERTNGILTDALEVFCLLSEKGLLLLLAGIILFCFRKTRKTGFCLAGAVCCSAVMTLVLKELVARPRPFVDAAAVYHNWWQFIGLPAESGFAFPSGHTTVAMAAAAALFLSYNKKVSWMSFLFVILTGFSRCYLMVHYPSDILGGMVIGAAGAVIVYLLYPVFFGLWNKVMPAKLTGRSE